MNKLLRPCFFYLRERLRPPTLWEFLAVLIGLIGLIQAELHYGSLAKLLGLFMEHAR